MNVMSRWRIVFTAAAALWMGLILLAPRLTSAVLPVVRELALFVYATGALVCHQRPERSFILSGVQLPVCARCTGIYAGAAMISIGLVLWSVSRQSSPASSLPDRSLVWWTLLLATVPTAATLIAEWTSGQMPGHWLRACSGLPLGGAVAWLVCRSFEARTA